MPESGIPKRRPASTNDVNVQPPDTRRARHTGPRRFRVHGALRSPSPGGWLQHGPAEPPCWRADPKHGLVRQKGRPFRHRPDVTGEPERSQVFEECGGCVAEGRNCLEPGDFFGAEAQILEVVERLLQPRKDEAVPMGRKTPGEQLERRAKPRDGRSSQLSVSVPKLTADGCWLITNLGSLFPATYAKGECPHLP